MAKAAKPKAPEGGADPEVQEEKKSTKKLSKEEAQAVVDRYSGINMPGNEPKELMEARKVLKSKEG